MIIVKIDVKKIDKKHLFQGQKGLYLDLVLFGNKDTQYSDYVVIQSISKDARDKGEKGNILGSASVLKKSGNTSNETGPDGLPF